MKRYITLAIVSVAVILSSCSRELPSSVKNSSEVCFSIAANPATRTAPIRTMADFNREVTSMAGIIYVDAYANPICFLDDFEYSSALGGWHDVTRFLNWPTAQHFMTVLMLAPGSEKNRIVFDPSNGMSYTLPVDFRQMKDVYGAQAFGLPGDDFTLYMNPLLAPLQFNIAEKPSYMDVLSVKISEFHQSGIFEPQYNDDGETIGDWYWQFRPEDKLVDFEIKNVAENGDLVPLTNEFFAANNLFLIPEGRNVSLTIIVRNNTTGVIYTSTISDLWVGLNAWYLRGINLFINDNPNVPKWRIETGDNDRYASCWYGLKSAQFDLIIK